MKIVMNHDLKWMRSDKHGISMGVNDNLPQNAMADVIFAKINGKEILTPHYHIRPKGPSGEDDGFESFFFYNGGHFELIKKEGSEIINTKEPITLTFYSGEDEIHGIKNLSNNDLYFQVYCAPKFDSDEERFVNKI